MFKFFLRILQTPNPISQNFRAMYPFEEFIEVLFNSQTLLMILQVLIPLPKNLENKSQDAKDLCGMGQG
jgi:hypothetical protein